ncbi:MAG: AAA family ATPase [Deltaproteobacteria bacterium]|nr:AAA family ATPase [Deltaproteobacteria bacterium]
MKPTKLTRLSVGNFTAFAKLELDFSPGMNVFVGANATGKTHLLKLMYAACDATNTKEPWEARLVPIFRPHRDVLGRLVHAKAGTAKLHLKSTSGQITASFKREKQFARISRPAGPDSWYDMLIDAVYLPARDMTEIGPGLVSLYDEREIRLEETYRTIMASAILPSYRPQRLGKDEKQLLEVIRRELPGKITMEGKEFFLRHKWGDLEFTLVAEGMRKLGLLWLLIANGTINRDTILFWDEPESNLNPKLMGVVIDILLAWQRLGVQVFVATHNYVVLKELDLRRTPKDKIRYYSLYRIPETDQIVCDSEDDLAAVDPNFVVDTLADLYDRDLERALGGK